ncbi:MAG TPA: hypothetical protein VEH00_02510 [Steroidobacteraceae bacterium]|nr:hypothetical protein [Steroidobacteraceae bacterium]
MNEIELLRNQIATERRHVREIASACAAAHAGEPARPADAALEALRTACSDYLGCVLEWFDRRDQRLGELYPRHPAADSRTALESLKQAGPAPATWQALAAFINGPWDAQRAAIDALLATNPRVADWRAFCGIDADSVWRERMLYARVRAALPSGEPHAR